MEACKKGRPTYWNKCPATNNGSKQLTTPNVDILGAEGHEVVGRADGVCRDVDTKGNDNQADGAKGGSCAAGMRARCGPELDDFNGVPDDFAICRLSGCGSEDAEQANDSCKSRWLAISR